MRFQPGAKMSAQVNYFAPGTSTTYHLLNSSVANSIGLLDLYFG